MSTGEEARQKATMTTSTVRTEPETPAAESPAVRDVYSSRNNKPTAINQSSTSANSKQPRGLQFWATILGLSLVGFLPALESTVVSTALPTISADLQGGRTFVWVVNAYFLSWFVSSLLSTFSVLTQAALPSNPL